MVLQLYAALKNGFSTILKFLHECSLTLSDDPKRLDDPKTRSGSPTGQTCTQRLLSALVFADFSCAQRFGSSVLGCPKRLRPLERMSTESCPSLSTSAPRRSMHKSRRNCAHFQTESGLKGVALEQQLRRRRHQQESLLKTPPSW